MACESQQQKLSALQEERADVEKQLQQPNLPPTERSQLLPRAQKPRTRDYRGTSGTQTMSGSAASVTPASGRARQYSGNHPALSRHGAEHDRQTAPISAKKFPQDVGREWAQPLAPNDDYELLVPCTGWMVHPRDVTGDFPFSHPFGLDWEFSLALDKPPTGAAPSITC
jgi:hypothetical protein